MDLLGQQAGSVFPIEGDDFLRAVERGLIAGGLPERGVEARAVGGIERVGKRLAFSL